MNAATHVIRRAEVDGRLVDVAWSAGRVVAIEPVGRAIASAGTVELDAAGGAVIPGLHDHHIHLLALAAARRSVTVGPPEVTDAASFATALSAACSDSAGGWVRAIRYHESVAGELDATLLDRLVPSGRDVPVRVQHRSGQLWVLNSRAIATTRLDDVRVPGVERDAAGRPTGRVYGLDAELRGRFGDAPPDLAALGRELASYGVTGVTDLTPTESAGEVDLLASAVTSPTFPVSVTITGGLLLPDSAAAGLARGPVKFLPADHSALDPDTLAAGISAAHRGGRAVAVHCVSRVGLVVALAAWREAGARPGDRIEHGAVLPAELIAEVSALGLTVVTQPNFVRERGDAYLADVEAADVGHLWRCGTLAAAGVPVAGGTDAPFGHPDPWRAVTAAIERRTESGQLLGAHEMVAPGRALDLFLGAAGSPATPHRIAPGEPTDLCLLDRPLAEALQTPEAESVRATLGRGGLTVLR